MESKKSIPQILADIWARPIERDEEARYQSQMAEHHYLGALPSSLSPLFAKHSIDNGKKGKDCSHTFGLFVRLYLCP